MSGKEPAWSFSAVKSFEDCPKKHYHLKVAKDYSEPHGEALFYGNAFHKAAEDYVGLGVALPEKFEYAKPALDALNALEGEKLCEYKMGLTQDLKPCAYFGRNVWFRGAADLLIMRGDTAMVIDYKTSKNARYADKGQLELMALATFAHFPKIKKVKGGLLFVVCNAFVKDTYEITDSPQLWEKWLTKYSRLKAAHNNDVWNAKQNPLCRKHCVVTECIHNGRG